MTTVQVSPHLANLANAALIMEMGISVQESLGFTSPFYRVMFSLMGRLLSQDPKMYMAMAMENPATIPMLERRIKIEQKILRMLKRKDRKGFLKLFALIKDHFGDAVAKEANELFLRLNAVLKTLYGQNSATLEYSASVDRPGLLDQILRVFKRRKINLKGINHVEFANNRMQFTIAFGELKQSDSVRRAIEEIESWKDIPIKIAA
jgi:hypothetical protein